MRAALLGSLGGLVVLLTTADAVRTTLFAGSGGGLLTRGVALGVWRLSRLVGRSPGSRALSVAGPLALLSTVVVWSVLLWAGWTAVFDASPGAVRVSSTSAPASLLGRFYFAGFTVFTLGVGDLVPGEGVWQPLTALASFIGLFVVTLSITYLLSVVGAVVQRRSLAQSVAGLGSDGAEIVLLHHDRGRWDPSLALHLHTLSDQLTKVTEQHLAYPVLHYFHATDRQSSTPMAVAALDDALLLLAEGVVPEHRPSRAVYADLDSAVSSYARTVRSSVTAASAAPPAPELERLRRAGVPVVDDHAYAQGARQRHSRRGILHSIVRDDARSWPSPRAGADAPA